MLIDEIVRGAAAAAPVTGQRQPISPHDVTFNRYVNTNNETLSQWITRACAAAGVPASSGWLAGIPVAVGRESSGQPNACNCNDLNYTTPAGYSRVRDWGLGYFSNGVRWMNGELNEFQCSRGILQTIPQTFAEYHCAGTSNNIYDPVACIAAAIQYVIHVYGVAADGHNLASRVQQFDPNRSPRGY